MRIGLKFTIMVFVLLLSLGCIIRQFPGDKLPLVESVSPPEGLVKPSLTYWFSAELDGISTYISNEKLEKEFASVLVDSGYFASVSPYGHGQEDMIIKTHFASSVDPLAAAVNIFNGMMIIQVLPSWFTEKLIVTAKVRYKDSNERIYQVKDTMTTVMWFPVVFLSPVATCTCSPIQMIQASHLLK